MVAEALNVLNAWEVCDPRTGPAVLIAWLTVFLASTEHLTLEEASARVCVLSLPELLGTLT